MDTHAETPLSDVTASAANAIPMIHLPDSWDVRSWDWRGPPQKDCSLCGFSPDLPNRLFSNFRTFNADELSKAAQHGCASCSIKLAILRKSLELKGLLASEDTASISTINYETQVIISLNRPMFSLMPKYDEATSTWDFGASSLSLTAHFATGDEGVTPRGLPKRCLLTPDISFQRSLQWARRRVTECLGVHDECQSGNGSSFLPTRLINVEAGMDGDVILQRNSSIPAGSRYIALSYCWGNYQPDCLTTRATLKDRMTRIPWSTLPATFQDVVSFTRSLGVKYLWIDGVCIIQGDAEDWRSEAGKMFHVYKNAYLTLAALYGSRPTTGLRARTTLDEHQPKLVADLELHGEHYPLYISPTHARVSDWGITSTDPELSSVKDSAPLLSRAWAYQERIISPRVLFFTESEVIFECLHATSCECGAMNTQDGFVQMKRDLVSDNDTKDGSAADNRPYSSQHIILSQDNNRMETWHSIVNNYSALGLSVASDKLPAVAAIAEQLHFAHPSERYLSGLWSGTLQEDLLWRTNSRKLDGRGRISGIPTWSWASVHSAVAYDSWAVTATADIDAEVDNRPSDYAEGNAFAVQQRSELVLHGRLLSSGAQYSGPEKRFEIKIKSGTRCFEFLSDDKNHYIYLDEPLKDFADLQKIAVLQIATFIQRRPSRLYMLLRPGSRGGETVYSRLGIFHYFLYGDQAPLEERFHSVFERHSVSTICTLV